MEAERDQMATPSCKGEWDTGKQNCSSLEIGILKPGRKYGFSEVDEKLGEGYGRGSLESWPHLMYKVL